MLTLFKSHTTQNELTLGLLHFFPPKAKLLETSTEEWMESVKDWLISSAASDPQRAVIRGYHNQLQSIPSC